MQVLKVDRNDREETAVLHLNIDEITVINNALFYVATMEPDDSGVKGPLKSEIERSGDLLALWGSLQKLVNYGLVGRTDVSGRSREEKDNDV